MIGPEGLQERLFLTLARAEDAVSRLDEQVRLSPLAAGWRARMDFSEAAAWAWSNNELAPLEDLVLHDAEMDLRVPEQSLRRAYGLVRARRKAWLGGGELVSPEGALWLAGRQGQAPAAIDAQARPVTPSEDVTNEAASVLDPLEAGLKRLAVGVTDDARAALADWAGALAAVENRAPALLTAAFSLEAWRLAAPSPREDFVGAVLVAAWLRARGRVGSHILGLQAGLRQAGPLPGRLAAGPAAARLLYQLDVLRRSALIGSEELRRLGLVRQVLQRRTAGRRAGSRAAELADLLLANPIVSAPFAAERLGVSQQTVRALMPSLGSSVREITGRRRFQAWKV